MRAMGRWLARPEARRVGRTVGETTADRARRDDGERLGFDRLAARSAEVAGDPERLTRAELTELADLVDKVHGIAHTSRRVATGTPRR